MKLSTSFFLLALAALFPTETLELGDLQRYHAESSVGPLKLMGNAIWSSGQDGDGYDTALSTDTQLQVPGSLSGCGTTEDSKVKQVIRSANVKFDNQLGSRAHAQLVPKLMISAQSSAVLTITLTRDPTTVKGTQTPSITLVTAAHDGFPKGDLEDLDVVFDQGLAARINKIMHMTLFCKDGDKFDRKNRSQNKRAGTTYGGAIFAAEAAAILYLGTGHLASGFKGTAGVAALAAHIVNMFIQGVAQSNITPQLPGQIANFLFEDKKSLGQDNRTDGFLIATSSRAAPMAAATNCPDPKETALLCGHDDDDVINDCEQKRPAPTSTYVVCADGKYKGCECIGPVEFIDNDATCDEMDFILWLVAISAETSTKKPVCKTQDLSDIPSNVSSSANNTVHKHVCEMWDKERSYEMRVDAAGKNKNPEPHMKGVIHHRTPPPDPNTWKGYDIFLSYTVSGARNGLLNGLQQGIPET